MDKSYIWSIIAVFLSSYLSYWEDIYTGLLPFLIYLGKNIFVNNLLELTN